MTMAYYTDLLYQDIAANLHKRFTAQGAPVGDTFSDTCRASANTFTPTLEPIGFN